MHDAHYFGAMAEKYFDDKTRDAAVSRQRQQKTVESYARLPEEFTVEEVMRCFNLASEASARAKISRLIADKLAKKGENFNEKGKAKALYYKVYSYISWLRIMHHASRIIY